MSANLNGLISAVRDWSNRETEVLSDDTIKRCIRWAIDKAVRRLRIVPMETTATYTTVGTGASNIRSEADIEGRTVSSILLPSDLIEIISLSTVDTAGGTVRMFDTKADTRTFFSPIAEQYSADILWTRKGERIYMSSAFPAALETSVELHYYRRPADIDATYSVVPANFEATASYVSLTADQSGAAGTNEAFFLIKDSSDANVTNIANVFTSGNTATTTSETTADAAQGIYKFEGNAVPNWFIDDNERLVVYGALVEVFSYLQEDDQVQKYMAMFDREMKDLTYEEEQRNAKGGNVQMNFNGGGLI